MATITYWADDVPAARDWYRDLLGIDAYFQRPDADHPAYVEFRVGDHHDELGIVSRSYAPDLRDTGTGGVVLYWHVDDIEAAVERLLAMGATAYEPITEREAGFVTGAVIDPFGNILGVMHNPHWLHIMARDVDQPTTASAERSLA